MKYVLKTEKNASGNVVFSKERRGKKFAYLAKDENGNVGVVDKNWILQHQKEIVNLGVSGDSIYPVEIKKSENKATVKTAPQVVEVEEDEIDIDEVLDFAENFYTNLGDSLRVDSIDEVYFIDGQYICGRQVEVWMDFSDINPFNIVEVLDKIDKAIEDFDPFEETRIAIEGGAVSRNDIEDIYDTVNAFKEFKDRLDERYQSFNRYRYKFNNMNFSEEQLEKCVNTFVFYYWYRDNI